jgi:leader peptidase (prepilin peptidase)/N-methyltransferase
MVAAGMTPTEADREIIEAINEERITARRMVLLEMAWLLPAIVLGVVACIVVARTAAGAELWQRALNWTPRNGAWRPVLGVTTALGGFIVAGAVAWGVRIFFTLVLGKEAFGMGDVHLMAAAGAVAGWPVVVAGFFLAAPLALAAVLIWLIRKRSRAVWYGPWLGLGIVIAIVAYEPIAERARASIEVILWLFGHGGR